MNNMTDEMIVALHLKGKERLFTAPLAFHENSIRLEYKDFHFLNL